MNPYGPTTAEIQDDLRAAEQRIAELEELVSQLRAIIRSQETQTYKNFESCVTSQELSI
jgi:hypothetical protein